MKKYLIMVCCFMALVLLSCPAFAERRGDGRQERSYDGGRYYRDSGRSQYERRQDDYRRDRWRDHHRHRDHRDRRHHRHRDWWWERRGGLQIVIPPVTPQAYTPVYPSCYGSYCY